MADELEHAKETLEHASHEAGHGGGSDKLPRNVAILVSTIAACLALAEMGEKAAQNSYLTHHITLSDTWAFYQAKNIRATTYAASADMIESLPVIDAEARKRVDRLRAEAARMRDDPKTNEGTKQLMETAKHQQEERDHAFHRFHQFEFATGALQISIVLASVSLVTKIKPLTYAAAIIGLLAAGFAGGVASGMI
jgi:hypothetical protein